MLLDKLYRLFHTDLLKIIRYHGVHDYDVSDIAAEFYIKVDKALKNGKAHIIYREGKLNRQYLFSIIRNIVYAEFKKNKDLSCIDDHCIPCYPDYDEKRVDMLLKIIETIPSHFDRRLIKVYLHEGFTIRKMAAETKLSATTIFHSLKKSKEFIKHKILQYEGTIR